jgi:hypothetical protein
VWWDYIRLTTADFVKMSCQILIDAARSLVQLCVAVFLSCLWVVCMYVYRRVWTLLPMLLIHETTSLCPVFGCKQCETSERMPGVHLCTACGNYNASMAVSSRFYIEQKTASELANDFPGWLQPFVHRFAVFALQSEHHVLTPLQLCELLLIVYLLTGVMRTLLDQCRPQRRDEPPPTAQFTHIATHGRTPMMPQQRSFFTMIGEEDFQSPFEVKKQI